MFINGSDVDQEQPPISNSNQPEADHTSSSFRFQPGLICLSYLFWRILIIMDCETLVNGAPFSWVAVATKNPQTVQYSGTQKPPAKYIRKQGKQLPSRSTAEYNCHMDRCQARQLPRNLLESSPHSPSTTHAETRTWLFGRKKLKETETAQPLYATLNCALNWDHQLSMGNVLVLGCWCGPRDHGRDIDNSDNQPWSGAVNRDKKILGWAKQFSSPVINHSFQWQEQFLGTTIFGLLLTALFADWQLQLATSETLRKVMVAHVSKKHGLPWWIPPNHPSMCICHVHLH